MLHKNKKIAILALNLKPILNLNPRSNPDVNPNLNKI